MKVFVVNVYICENEVIKGCCADPVESLRLQLSKVNETNSLFFEIICLFQDLPETSEAIAAYLGTLLQADKHSRSPPTETDKHE